MCPKVNSILKSHLKQRLPGDLEKTLGLNKNVKEEYKIANSHNYERNIKIVWKK